MGKQKDLLTNKVKTLERKLLEVQASRPFRHHHASTKIKEASIDKLMGSAVILQLTVLGGREIFSPVMISDGLSDETIAAIKKDLNRSFHLLTMYKPEDYHEDDYKEDQNV